VKRFHGLFFGLEIISTLSSRSRHHHRRPAVGGISLRSIVSMLSSRSRHHHRDD